MSDYLPQMTSARCVPCIGECSTCPTSQARRDAFLRKYFPQFRHSSSVRQDTRFEVDRVGYLVADDMARPVSRCEMFGS